MEEHWLKKRLSEIGKTKTEFSCSIGIAINRIWELEHGRWKFQACHIRKASEFLQFDTLAFLDFINGEISEKQLWEAKQQTVSQKDLELLKAIKQVQQQS